MSLRSPPSLAALDRKLVAGTVTEPPVEVLSPREARLQQQMICLLVANGETVSAVATKLLIGVRDVERVLSTPQGMDMVVRFQHDICPNPRERIQKMALIALDVQLRLLLGPASDNVKANVAQSVIDRAQGKATQVIEARTMHFDVKDAAAVEKALLASQDKLKKIEDLRKTLSISITSRADSG